MTNEEAIRVLMQVNKILVNDDSWLESTHEPLNTVFDIAIKSLEQTRWIPCSERLPDKDGCYLVSTTGTNNDIIDIAYYTEEIWHKASRIKAWMPLPSPYKAESEDKE